MTNPAGIDLADGTFWDGLKLRDNAWVNVTYEWTGTGPWGTIVPPGAVLNVRSQPTGAAAQAGLAARYAQVRIDCVVKGEPVDGTQGTSDDWFQLDDDKFVSAAYVQVGQAPGACRA